MVGKIFFFKKRRMIYISLLSCLVILANTEKECDVVG